MKTDDLKSSKKINPESSKNEDGNLDLGLDSDHSSNPEYQRFNNDNDVVSYGKGKNAKPGKMSAEDEEGRIMRK